MPFSYLSHVILDMSLRINTPRFFLDTYRTRNRDTTTNRDQADCEKAVEDRFKSFLDQQSSLLPK